MYDVTAIADDAFTNAGVGNLTLGAEVTTIGIGAFQDNSLGAVTIPDTVTTIGDFAFSGNNITDVTIPSSVTSIEAYAFSQNASLSAVTFLGAAPSIVDNSFGSPTGKTLRFPWRFGDPQTGGGYTTPTWVGYHTVAVATVDFDPDGGAPAPVDQEIDINGSNTATEPTAPAKTGFVFLGWFSDALFILLYDFADAIDGDLTLFAKHGIAPALTGDPTATATVGTPFTYTPSVGGDPAPAVTHSGSLPASLSVDATTGVISGTPMDTAGDYSATLTATSASGTSNLNVTITLEVGAAVELTLSASDTTPDEGDTIKITSAGEDIAGNDVGDISDQVMLTSDVATDVIDDNTVTFPTASPHTITATIGNVTETILINVTPAAADDTSGEGALSDTDPDNGALPDTGSPLTPAGLLLAALLIVVGAAATHTGRARRGQHRA